VTFIILTGHCDIRHLIRRDCRRDKNSRNKPKGQNDRTDDHRRRESARVPSAASVSVVVTMGDCRLHRQRGRREHRKHTWLASGNNCPDAAGGTATHSASPTFGAAPCRRGRLSRGWCGCARFGDQRSTGREIGRVHCASMVTTIRRQLACRSFMWSSDLTQEHSLGGRSCARRG
jgi:hypothetical protein